MFRRAAFLSLILLPLGAEASEVKEKTAESPLAVFLSPQQKQRCVEVIKEYSQKSLEEETKSLRPSTDNENLIQDHDNSIQFNETSPMNYLEEVILWAKKMEEFHKNLAAHIVAQNSKTVVQIALDLYRGVAPREHIRDIH